MCSSLCHRVGNARSLRINSSQQSDCLTVCLMYLVLLWWWRIQQQNNTISCSSITGDNLLFIFCTVITAVLPRFSTFLTALKAGMVCLQCKICVIHAWALQRWASFLQWALYKCLYLYLYYRVVSFVESNSQRRNNLYYAKNVWFRSIPRQNAVLNEISTGKRLIFTVYICIYNSLCSEYNRLFA